MWVELVALIVACGVLALRSDRDMRAIAAAVGAVLSAQMAGSALYAVKRWVPIGGFGGGIKNLGTLRALAAAMALTAIFAGTSCVIVLVKEGALRPSTARSSLVVAGCGLVVVVALPLVLGAGGNATMDLTSIGAYALLFSIPWGVGIVGAAWLPRPPAVAVLVTVAASACLLIASPALRPNVVEIHDPVAGVAFVFLTTSIAGVTTIRNSGRTTSLRPGSSPTPWSKTLAGRIPVLDRRQSSLPSRTRPCSPDAGGSRRRQTDRPSPAVPPSPSVHTSIEGRHGPRDEAVI